MPRGVKGSGKPRNFNDVFSKYKTYDPEKEGYGHRTQWKQAFNERMGYEEAKEVFGNRNEMSQSLDELELTEMPKSLADLKSVYRKLIFKHHPDRGGDTAKAQRIIAAYTILEKKLSDLYELKDVFLRNS
jgi:hypothetical protein